MSIVRLLAIGDVVGRPGRLVLKQKLPELVRSRAVDLVIANVENAAAGSGITQTIFNNVRSYGVDVVTLGDHALRKADIYPTLTASERIIRPANLSPKAPGKGYTVVTTPGGVKVGVMNLIGRIYMDQLPSDDPFATADRILASLTAAGVKVIVCDMHAEASSEKVAMGHHLDGRASFVFGTHTHIPTADARLLAGGTAVISDVGMTGPYDSVLGRRKDRILKFMRESVSQHFEVATADVRLCGALVEVDTETGKAVNIERIEVQGADVDKAYDADDKNPNAPGQPGGE